MRTRMYVAMFPQTFGQIAYLPKASSRVPSCEFGEAIFQPALFIQIRQWKQQLNQQNCSRTELKIEAIDTNCEIELILKCELLTLSVMDTAQKMKFSIKGKLMQI